MTYASIILALLQLANWLFGRAHDQGLIQEGEDRAIARQILEMQARSTTLKALEAKRAGMTPEDIVRELDGNADFRD